ncbi:alcohol dehydrogenase catalytic domain-containing protein [Rhodococcoides fascians A25f]|uniref:alcohol dehydrogenase catalytic domain-containing protein n=1 Tax=Rhodococcoides fascians TaxID=1828 RepID=UPI0005685D63|nr:alcohol dehydrogenase catalytic domain-containing protein [Rhodococcus fascians]QII07830.1 alcohol dehydrogenase catalytic domain-containing protein [Rhodococcus fascians A25f]
MQAWQLIGANAPLTLNDVEPPTAGADQVVVDVKAAGICHSDVGYLDGTLTHYLAFTPITLGHEIAGTISSVGEGVVDFSVGQRVAAAARPGGPGTRTDGGFAHQVMVPAKLLAALPDAVSWEQAAPAADAGTASLRALRVGGVEAGTKLGIIGAGGLGHLAIQMARVIGADVYVAETNEQVRHSVAALDGVRVSTSILGFADAKLDVVVDFAGFGTTTAEAIDTIGFNGTIVQVGLGRKHATISVQAMVEKKLHFVGSPGGKTEDLVDVLAMMAAGTIKSNVTTIGFGEIGDAITRLQRGELLGRAVALLDQPAHFTSSRTAP